MLPVGGADGQPESSINRNHVSSSFINSYYYNMYNPHNAMGIIDSSEYLNIAN